MKIRPLIRELATVLAALRQWQMDWEAHPAELAESIHFEDVKPLTSAEIDALCERLNDNEKGVRMILTPPSEYEDIDECVLSNFDHRIDRTWEQRLRSEKVVLQYSGYGFCGEVWFHKDHFHCLIRIHGQARETLFRPTLEEIMADVCDKYGTE